MSSNNDAMCASSPEAVEEGLGKQTRNFPEGRVVFAVITDETNAEGKTLVNVREPDALESHSSKPYSPFAGIEAFSSRRFSREDIGKAVACIPVAGLDQLMIAGFLPETRSDKTEFPDTILNHIFYRTLYCRGLPGMSSALFLCHALAAHPKRFSPIALTHWTGGIF